MVLPARVLPAQDSTGTLLVKVYRQRDSLPIAGAFVRSGRLATVTDVAGQARLELPARLGSVLVTHPAYRSQTFEMTIVANVSQGADIYLGPDLGPTGRASLVGRLGLAKEPLPITVYDDATVVRSLQRRSSDLLGLFQDPAARPEAMSGALDATRLRIHGLPGHYTGLLLDGFPILDGRSGGFGLLEASPSDLAGVELLTGPASALYGPSAAAGVVNLISRRPDRDRVRLAFDQSSEKGGDVVFWGARRFSPTAGGTMTVDFHQQRLVDADDDGWGEFPRAIRLSARPRLYLDRPNGDGMMLTAGFTSEDRTGGFLTATTDPNPYREERRTARGDLGFEAHRLDARGGRFETRFATAFQSTSHRFDATRERDRRYVAFGEATYTRPVGDLTVLAGAAFEYESLRERDLPAFDYTHHFPSAFARVAIPLAAKVLATVTGRCDQHNVHGLQCMPRASVLIQGSDQVDVRASLGDGYYAPTALTDEVETIGLHATVPVAAKVERIRSASVDVRAAAERLTFAASLSYSRVSLPVRLVPFVGDPEGRLRLLNLAEPTKVFSGVLSGNYTGRMVSLRAFYGFLDGSEGVPGGTGRRDLALSPKHSLGATVTWRSVAPAEPVVSVDLTYRGRQSVYDNPYLDRTPGYLLASGMASLRSGRARLYLNGENLTDRKLRDYHQVLLPAPVDGGRRTVTPWVPLRGRVISIGAVVDW